MTHADVRCTEAHILKQIGTPCSSSRASFAGDDSDAGMALLESVHGSPACSEHGYVLSIVLNAELPLSKHD